MQHMSSQTFERQTSLDRRKKRILSFILLVIVALLGGGGERWFHEWRFWVSTDDAYIQGNIATISAKVGGYVRQVAVEANQQVHQGDILFQLDDGDYQIALDEAQAKFATHQNSLRRIEAQIKAARAQLDDAQAAREATIAIKTNAELGFARIKELKQQRVATQSGEDDARSQLEQASANVARAAAQVAAAEANIAVLQAQYTESASMIRSLELGLKKAQRDFDSTILRAPFDGIIGNLSAKKGDLVLSGQRLAALVPVHALYIDANYKETQLHDIRGGEKVRITIDGIRGDIFEGEVLSLAPASGAVFSLLPPQNATGNFTKVVQRIPVRISLPQQALETGRLRAGMSVVVSIDTRTRPTEKQPALAQCVSGENCTSNQRLELSHRDRAKLQSILATLPPLP